MLMTWTYLVAACVPIALILLVTPYRRVPGTSIYIAMLALSAVLSFASLMQYVMPELQTVRSPYATVLPDGTEEFEELMAVPALNLDAAFVHQHRADVSGNAAWLGEDPFMDDLFVRAAEKSFVTCEQVVTTEHLLDDLVTTAPPRDRETEAARARARAAKRFGSAAAPGPGISEHVFHDFYPVPVEGMRALLAGFSGSLVDLEVLVCFGDY